MWAGPTLSAKQIQNVSRSAPFVATTAAAIQRFMSAGLRSAALGAGFRSALGLEPDGCRGGHPGDLEDADQLGQRCRLLFQALRGRLALFDERGVLPRDLIERVDGAADLCPMPVVCFGCLGGLRGRPARNGTQFLPLGVGGYDRRFAASSRLLS